MDRVCLSNRSQRHRPMDRRACVRVRAGDIDRGRRGRIMERHVSVGGSQRTAAARRAMAFFAGCRHQQQPMQIKNAIH